MKIRVETHIFKLLARIFVESKVEFKYIYTGHL